jgi:hypothetical protein
MKSKYPSKSLNLSNSRWFAYATAGAASALAAAGTAEAEIHYSGQINHQFNGTGVSSAYFPLTSGGQLFFQHFGLGSRSGAARMEIVGPQGRQGDSIGGIVGEFVHYGGFYISNLARGLSLSQLRFGAYCKFTYVSSTTELRCFGGTIGYDDRPNGKFKGRGRGYIGFTFDVGNGPQYGWARIKTEGGSRNRFILEDYAWADPGENIQTGRKNGSGEITANANKGSLGLLALGGAGLMAWRGQHPMPQLQD